MNYNINLNEDKIFDVLIIGAGPSGLFAAFEAASAGLFVCICETLSSYGGQCSVLYPEKFIYDIPGHIKISGKDLSDNLFMQLKRFDDLIEYNFNCEINFCNNIESGLFFLKTSNNLEIYAKTIIISSGGGSFAPNKPSTKNLEYFENLDKVHYKITDKSIYKNKIIAIAGGGDSAVDWAIGLSDISSKIYFIHRRDSLKADESSLKELYKIASSNKIEFKIPYIAEELNKDDYEKNKENQTYELILKNFNQEDLYEKIKIDYFLPFFGLKSDNKAIKNFGLEFNIRKKIIVNSFMRTNIDGIFAAGDIVEYDGKTKLLVSCFHESSVCVNSILEYLEKKYNKKKSSFMYSTSKF
jgi:thioredoxin reductase (NADPH)